MLLPEITLVVHEVNTVAHPTLAPGWRWAVHAGGGRPDDLSRCAQAGWAPTEAAAWAEGEQVAAACTQACRTFGIPADLRRLRLLRDPIAAGADRIRILTERGN